MKTLGLPEGSFVVFGSCPMALADIREANDIDMLVSPKIYDQLRKKGWKVLDKGPKDTPVTYNVFEAHKNWDFSDYSPTLEQLLSTATIVDGIPFASLAEVRKWKSTSDKPKYAEDVRLIDRYFSKKNV